MKVGISNYAIWALDAVWAGRCQQLVMRPSVTLRRDEAYETVFRAASARAAARMFGGRIPE